MAGTRWVPVCQWCGKSGGMTNSAMTSSPTSTPIVGGKCTSHPSGKADANHGAKWEPRDIGQNENASRWIPVCQWCGKTGGMTNSRMNNPPTSAPIVGGRCDCHPSGNPGMNHGAKWESR